MVTISLPPELEQFVKDSVAQGAYASVNEAMQEALCLLQEKEACLRQLKDDVALGIAQSDAGELIPAEVAFKSFQQRNGIVPRS